MITDTEKQKIRDEFEKEFNSLYGINVSVVNSEPVLIGNPPVADILSFIYTILDKTIKSKLEAVIAEIEIRRPQSCTIENTPEFWSNECIDDILKIINKHKSEFTGKKHLMIKCEKCDQILLDVGNLDCEVTELRYGGHVECKFNNKYK